MAFLVILLWLLEFVLALAFLGWLEERMERSVANASTWDAKGSSSGAVGHLPPADLVERGPGAENPGPAASGTGAAADVESAATDTDGQGYPPMSSLWRRPVGFLNENSLARSLMVTVLIIVTILATATWLDNSAADRQEVASNTSFVQQVAFDPTAEVKPFTEFNLHGARLSGLPLGCIKLTPPKGCAELGSANLSEADLSGANLVGAFLPLCGPVGRVHGNYGPHGRGSAPSQPERSQSEQCDSHGRGSALRRPDGCDHDPGEPQGR